MPRYSDSWRRRSTPFVPTPRGRRSSPISTGPSRRSSSDPQDAAVPARAAELLRRLSEGFGLVGCVSGPPRGRGTPPGRRRLDRLRRQPRPRAALPGEEEPRLDPSLEGRETRRGGVRRRARPRRARAARPAARGQGTDPGPALARRRDERAAEARAHEIAADAGRAGLEPHWGRKVLEVRPVGGGGKDAAVAALLAADGFRLATYAGDDRTDLDAFRRLRELRERGELETAICVGVTSPEAPPELAEESDLQVDGPGGLAAICSRRWRPSGALHRPAARLRLPHRRRGDRARGDRGDRAPAAKPTRRPVSPPAGGCWRWSSASGWGARRAPPTASATPWPTRGRRPACPTETPTRIALLRLWPIGLTALVAGGPRHLLPGVAIIGAGYALLVSLAWHSHEAAVLASSSATG